MQGITAASIAQRRKDLARHLIAMLGERSTCKAARELADVLLEKLFKSCTDLMWQPDVLTALLAALDAMNSAVLGSLHLNRMDHRISFWLRKVHLPTSHSRTDKLSFWEFQIRILAVQAEDTTC